MAEFDFTDEELQLNKKGLLSPSQKGLLDAMAYSIRASWKSGVWIILFFMALGICIMLAVFLQSLNAQNLKILGPQMLVGLCFAVFAVFVITVLGIFLSRRQAAKLEAAQLLSAEGIISHDSDFSSGSGITSHYVYFGEKRLAFPDDMSKVFPEGTRFRVYYCKVGQIELVMSFEKIN